jgi:hypothetical protein
MNMIFYFVLCVVLVFSVFGPVYGTTDDDSARGEWFKDAKYAMFVHWGSYSALGGKWQGKTYYGIGEPQVNMTWS